MFRMVLTVLVLLLIAGALMVIIYNRVAASVAGLEDGSLRPCPQRPNCVSSLEAGGPPPLEYASTRQEALDALRTVMAERPRSRLVSQHPDYLHYTETSLLFRFIDDVEFLFDEKEPVIHFRSASRVGYSDWGVNRARIEEIRKALAQVRS